MLSSAAQSPNRRNRKGSNGGDSGSGPTQPDKKEHRRSKDRRGVSDVGETPASIFQAEDQSQSTEYSADACFLLNTIGEKFCSLKRESRVKAFKFLQESLAKNMGNLCTGSAAITLPQLIDKVIDIEDYLKGDTDKQGKNPLEAMREFLTTGKTDGI